jgi:exonuclease SbcD
MKFFHISDLHIGKRVNGYAMLEDQRYILEQILEQVRTECPDGVLIAGDLYDKSVPAAEAVELADWFLSGLAECRTEVWIISGNHDSAERVAYGGQLMEQAGVHVSRVFQGKLQQYDAGQVDITLMPFLRPAQVRRFYPDRVIETTGQAVEAVLGDVTLEPGRKHILVMHQFMTGASVCDSEEVSVGGTDQVDVSVVDRFDYVALGHLHGPQKVGRETVRYCGSPLKYSFSEACQKKSITVVELGDGQEEVQIRTIPLKPRLDLREIRGPLRELLRADTVCAGNPEDYLHVTLTDQEEILDAIGKLREVYPNVMRLDFASADSIWDSQESPECSLEEKTPLELFAEFFQSQNGYEMTERQTEFVRELLTETIRGEEM